MKGNILILDDNSSVLTALEMLLQTEYDNVFALRNPNCLISTIQKHQIDVVLLDMNFKAGINTGNEGAYRCCDSGMPVLYSTQRAIQEIWWHGLSKERKAELLEFYRMMSSKQS